MSSHNNKEETRKVRSQIARRYVDSSMLSVSVIGGNVHLTGVLGTLRSHPGVDLKGEMQQISQILRTLPGIRDVVWDVTQRS